MKLIDGKTVKFVLVGILNTVVGYTINLIALNAFGLSFWVSGALNYVLTSIMSFFLNKYFTFKSKGNLWKEALKFTVNIVICFTLAYGIAKPATFWVMQTAGEGVFDFIRTVSLGLLNERQAIIDNVATLVGMVLFVVFNYTGQRFFAFKDEE